MDNPIAKAVDASKFQQPQNHIRIVSDGTSATTKVYFGDTEEPIRGVMSVKINEISNENNIVTAELEFCPVAINVMALPEKERLAQQLRILLGSDYVVAKAEEMEKE